MEDKKMKVIFIILLFVWSLSNCGAQTAIETEKEAIKTVIMEADDSFKKNDFEMFKKYWANEGYSSLILYPSYVIVGWDSIAAHVQSLINNQISYPDSFQIGEGESYDFKIEIDENLARAYHSTKGKVKYKGEWYMMSVETLNYLYKKNNVWKIFFQSYHNDNTKKIGQY
jgi:hypothetical protein